MSAQRDIWEHLGKTDADWAVASAPGKRNGAWENDLDTFYESGAVRVDEVLRMLPEDFRCRSVLDYGAGTGRLSFRLAEKFERVTSADVSRSMAEILEHRASDRGITNISTVDLNTEQLPTDHDLAISLITLQHFGTMRTVDVALRKISKSLHPGGYAIVDFPTPPKKVLKRFQPRWQLYRLLRLLGIPVSVLDRFSLSGISMLYESTTDFTARLSDVGLDLLDCRLSNSPYSVMSTYVTKRR